jgi:hypothetical protein
MKISNFTVCLFTILGFVFFPQTKADIVIYQSGDINIGKILSEDEGGVQFQTAGSSENMHIPPSMVKDVRKEDSEPTGNIIPSWVKILSQLATNEWAHDIRQIPATVIDNGNLQDVPYISFRCNTAGYEINIYGDLDNPACIEIGAITYLVKANGAKSNCVNFISSVLNNDDVKQVVRGLKWKPKDLQETNGLTLEVTLPDEPDAYGGWWISVYNEDAITNARASGAELLSISQPKIASPKTNYYSWTPPENSSIAPENSWTPSDISTYSRPSSPKASNGGSVYVRGYYRKNGTYVNGYTRRASK